MLGRDMSCKEKESNIGEQKGNKGMCVGLGQNGQGGFL